MTGSVETTLTKQKKNSYYVIAFLHPTHPTLYDTTIKVNKMVVDLNSAIPTSNCTLQYDKDQCTFYFAVTSQTNCIIADIQQEGHSENRRFIHGTIKSNARQGHILAGIILPFSILIIVTVLGVFSYIIFARYTRKWFPLTYGSSSSIIICT